MVELERTLDEAHKAMWRCDLREAEDLLSNFPNGRKHPILLLSLAEVCLLEDP
jgi:hypothetical protein